MDKYKVLEKFKNFNFESLIGSEKSYKTVESIEDLSSLIKDIGESEIISIDIESTGLNPRLNEIIGISFSTKPGTGYYFPRKFYDVEKGCLVDFQVKSDRGNQHAHDLIRKVLQCTKGKHLVTHNGKFDFQFIEKDFGISLIENLWVDTVVLIHTLHESGLRRTEDSVIGTFSLKDSSVILSSKIGFSEEELANQEQKDLYESIEKNGGNTSSSNLEMFKADLDVMSKYASADTDLTLRLCYYFIPQLEEEGLYEFFFFDEVMPLYKEVTYYMEKYGVKVDLKLLESSMEDIKKDISKIEKEIIQELTKNEKFKYWVVESAREEFPAKNSGTFKTAFYKHHILKDINYQDKVSLSKSSLSALPDSPYKEFLLTGNTEDLDPINDIIKIQLHLWEEKNKGYINIKSKDQMGSFVFGVLGIKPLSKTKKGKPQFDEDFVESISDKFEWANKFRVYNKLYKIYSTYMLRLYDNSENGRYYFYYKQHGTVSGRYGSDAQQFPRPKEEGEEDPIVVKYNNLIRKFMISDEGRKFIDCDYESLEPKVFSHVSGDESLKNIFREGKDFYSTIAIKAEKLTGVSEYKKDPNFLKNVDPSKRHRAKFYSLGIPYGMKAFALSKLLEISVKEAQAIINGYLSGFPELAKWMSRTEDFAKNNGYIKSETGRIRHLKRFKDIYNAMGDKIMDYQFRSNLSHQIGPDKTTSLYRDYKNGLNSAYNHQIQSLAASIVNRAAVSINRKFKENNIDGWVCAQIHDQLIMDVNESDVQRAKDIVQYEMENTTKLSVPLTAPPAVALNWLEGH